MQPYTGPSLNTAHQPGEVTACLDCGGDLGGNRLRCPLCLQAAHNAIAELGLTRAVLPSDVARHRKLLDETG